MTQETNVSTSNKLLSIHQIWQRKDIYWINTYKTLLKYISKDYVNIFKPIVKGKSNSGKRYYVQEENVKKFIKMFENNELAE